MTTPTIVDLFAGPGGWDIAARDLGLDPIGIELSASACATRAANGLATIRASVADYPPERIGRIERRPGEPRFGRGFPAATFHPLDGHRDFGAGATMSGTGGASTPRPRAHSPQTERTTR